jgi:heterodisulfide reductase subunit A-like polyferredoxin
MPSMVGSPAPRRIQENSKPILAIRLFERSKSMTDKPVFVMCYCTGECPGFQSLNLWQLVNRVRNEMDVEFAIVHPQLCVDDGERFWKHVGRPGAKYLVGGCDPRMQRKMYKDALAEVGLDFDQQVTAMDLRNMETEVAINKVSETLAQMGK